MRLGIDFGTTNCTVGRLRKEGGRSIHPLIPSVIAWHNGHLKFGRDAQDILRSAATNVHPVRDLKLMLGTDRKLVFGQTVVDPEDVAAELLRHLVGAVAAGETVDLAVIGTPVQISLEHRQSLRRAAAKAGIPEVRFIYEPTAALIGAQRFDPPDRGGLVLVVDWGGGTLDIAVIRSDGERFEELAVGGDVADLGGTRLDEEICRLVLAADGELRAAVNEIPDGRERLKNEIEVMKLEILESLDGIDAPPEHHAPLWLKGATIRLEPYIVFDALATFADRAAGVIRDRLARARVSASQITSVLFAGGVCQSQTVRDRVMKEFHNARILATVSGTQEPLQLQELTGAGCVQVTGRDVLVELASALGVRQSDGSVCVLLPRGFPLRLNTFRKAEFLLTDPSATLAILDLGLLRSEEGSVSMLAGSGGSFESLKQVFVPAAASLGRKQTVLDHIDVQIGVDRDLAVTLSASSRTARESVLKHQSGIPLVLRFRG